MQKSGNIPSFFGICLKYANCTPFPRGKPRRFFICSFLMKTTEGWLVQSTGDIPIVHFGNRSTVYVAFNDYNFFSAYSLLLHHFVPRNS